MRIKLLSVHTLISPHTRVPGPPPAASLPQVSAVPTLSSHPYSTFCQLSALPAKHSQNPTRPWGSCSHREPVKTSQVTPLLCDKPLKRGVVHSRLDLLPVSLSSCLPPSPFTPASQASFPFSSNPAATCPPRGLRPDITKLLSSSLLITDLKLQTHPPHPLCTLDSSPSPGSPSLLPSSCLQARELAVSLPAFCSSAKRLSTQ